MKKTITTLMTIAMLANASNAFAYGCETADVMKAKQLSAPQKQGVQVDGMSPDAAGAASHKESMEDKGLKGLVMDCSMLFLSAGMGPSMIKQAACDMGCFKKIANYCDWKFTKHGTIKFKKGNAAAAICMPMFPVVLAFT